MALINTPPINPQPDDPPQIRQPDPSERRTALAVLLTGRPTPDDPAVDHFIQFTQQQGMSLEGLWALYRGQSPVSTVLIILTAGRAAVVFTTPITTRHRVQDTAELLATAIQAQNTTELCLIQSLLEPTQRHERDALTHAGFTRLASLVYMRCNCHPQTASPSSSASASDSPQAPIEFDSSPLTTFTWQEDRFQAFADAISASYQDTLDCPGLVGLRRIEDIIAGHRAVGRFDPRLWSAFYLNDQPAGVMLLNPLADQPELELVYLGIAPPFRNKGLASRLMRRAISLAHANNFAGIHLAVDEDNTPAMKLYKGLNFRTTARKVAMIYTLSQSTL
jgi:mycothiol synthase